ncbi:MAG: iron donor protein CyaY [Pseudomonadota bacterium]
MLSDVEYEEQIEATIQALEEALDEVEDDVDYELGGGILTVTFTNGTTIVVSRQPPVKQLWLATRSGGYHYEFDTDANDWKDTRTGGLFTPFLIKEMLDQGGVELEL